MTGQAGDGPATVTAELLVGDALERLRTLPDGLIQTCVTIPPYWGLRDYGVAGQIGLEPSLDEYVERLVAVFREVRRVLRPDGTLWLNLGDGYARNPAKGGSGTPNGRNEGRGYAGAQKSLSGLKPKDLIGLPWLVAFALRADGWWLRSAIVWEKPNGLPDSVRDRPVNAHEMVFLLTASSRYYYDCEAVKVPTVTTEHRNRASQAKATRDAAKMTRHGNDQSTLRSPHAYRHLRTVWRIHTKPYRGAHFAVMPEALVEPCITAGSRPGDLVLDPFAGTATVGVVALRLGRRFLGIELHPGQAEGARRRLEDVAPLLAKISLDPARPSVA